MFCNITITLDSIGKNICLLHLLWFSHSTGGFHGRVGIHIYTFPDGIYPEYKYVVGFERMGLEKFVKHIQFTPWKFLFSFVKLYKSLQNKHSKILIIQPNQPDRYINLDFTNYYNAQSLEYKYWQTQIINVFIEQESYLGFISDIENRVKK